MKSVKRIGQLPKEKKRNQLFCVRVGGKVAKERK